MKRLVSIAIATLLAFSLSAQMQTFVKRQADSLQAYSGPRVGVVLGGGGAKGASHIGVLKYLEEMGIPVSFVTGTSMGSIIGGLYALGYEPDELTDIISSVDWSRLMSNSIERNLLSAERRDYADRELLSVPFALGDMGYASQNIINSLPAAIINSSNIQNLFGRLSIGYTDSSNFDRLPIPYACVATDIITGDSVIIRSGSFPLAIRSSMAIPGIFSPVKWGPYLLADGGLVNNFPVDVCKSMGADIVIGVEVAGDLANSADELRSLPQMLSQYMALSTKGDRYQHRDMCDVYIHPDVSGYNMLSFSAESIDSLVHRGYVCAAQHHDELLAIKGRLEQQGKHLQSPRAIRLMDGDSLHIRKIKFNGADEELKWLNRANRMIKNGICTVDDLEAFVSSMRGTGYYSYVLYTLHTTGAEGVYDMEVHLETAKPHRIGMGFRFDSEESAAILFHFGFNELRPSGFKALLDLNLCYNFSADLRLMWAMRSAGDFNLDYNVSRINFSVRNTSARTFGAVQQRLRLYYSLDNIPAFSFKIGGLAQTFIDAEYIRSRSLFELNDVDSYYRNTSIGLFTTLDFDNRDDAYFPTRGMAMGVSGEVRLAYTKPPVDYQFDDMGNAIGEIHHPAGLVYPAYKTLRAYFKPAISIGQRFAILPSVGGRIFFDRDYYRDMPYLENIFGGTFDGRYVDHQFAFIGTPSPMLANNLMAIGRIDLRYRIIKNLYASAIVNVLYTNDMQKSLNPIIADYPSEDDPRWNTEEQVEPETSKWVRGLGVELAYKSILGPIAFDLMWNDVTKRFSGFFNLGYNF